jgi:hypothetical protein
MRRLACSAVVIAILLAGTVESMPVYDVEDHSRIDDNMANALVEKAEGALDKDAKGQIEKAKQAVAAMSGNVTEEAALAKQSAMNDAEKRLRQITVDAEIDNTNVKAMQDELDLAKKVAQHKVEVEKAIVDSNATDSLMKGVEEGKKQSDAHSDKLDALKNAVKAHRDALEKLRTNTATAKAATLKVHQAKAAGTALGVKIVDNHAQSVKNQIQKAKQALVANADAVAEKVALAKQSSLNNEQRLRQITSDAEIENKNMKAMQDELDMAQKVAKHKLEVEKAIVDTKASATLMKNIQDGKKQSEAHSQKLQALKNTVQAHQDALQKLHTNLAKMNAAKLKAQIEALQQKLNKLELKKGELEAAWSSNNSTLFVLQQSHNITQAQVLRNKKVADKEEQKAEGYAQELVVMKATAKQQEKHLKKVEDAAVLNTKVQNQAMREIKRKFENEMSTLEDKLYAMKQSLALKKAHLHELMDETKEVHQQEVNATSTLHRLAYSVKKQAKTNEYRAERFKEKKSEELDQLAELQQEYTKVKAASATSLSRLQLAHRKFDVVKKMAEETQGQIADAKQAAEQATKAAKEKSQELSKKKRAATTQLHDAEVGVLMLVKDVAHTKILAAPQHTKAKAIAKLLNKTKIERSSAKRNLDKFNGQIAELKPKIIKLLSQEQQLQMRLPQANGELQAVKAAAEEKREQKRDAKLKALEAVERHKRETARFATVAPEAVALQKKTDEAKQAKQQAEDDIVDVKAATEMQKTRFVNKMQELHQDLKDEAEQAEKDESNSQVLGKAYAALIAQVASVKQAIAQKHLENTKQERKMASEAERKRAHAGQLAISYDKARTRLMEGKEKLETFLNQSAIRAEMMVEKTKAEEQHLLEEAADAKDSARDAIENVHAVKQKVSKHMKRTISRERKMQILRKQGIMKLANYAKSVLKRLTAILSSDDKHNAELKDELQELEKEVHTMQNKDQKEQVAEEKTKSAVILLKQKESDAEAETKEEIARQTTQIANVEGGKVDSEQEQADAQMTQQKLEIAHLAQQIRASATKQKNITGTMNLEAMSIDKLRHLRVEMRKKMQDYTDGVEREHEDLKEEAAKNKDLEKELASLESAGARKKKKLALVIAERGADAGKVKEMMREIAQNKFKVRELKKKLGVDQKKGAQDEEELSHITHLVDDMSQKLSRTKEMELQDNEKAKLLGLKVNDEQDTVMKDKSKASSLELNIKSLERKLQAAKSSTMHDKNQEVEMQKRLANGTNKDNLFHDQALSEQLAVQKEKQEVSDEKDSLKGLKLEEQSASRTEAERAAQVSRLKQKLRQTKSAEKAVLEKKLSVEMATRTSEDADDVSDKSLKQMKEEAANLAQESEKQKEEMSHMQSVLRTSQEKEREEQRKMQMEERDTSTEKKTLEKQAREVSSLAHATKDKLAKEEGELEELTKEQERLKGLKIKNTLFLKQDQKTMGNIKKQQLTEAEEVKDLKEQVDEVDKKIASELSKDTEEQNVVAKNNAVNAALKESLVREKAMLKETTVEVNDLNTKEEEEKSKKMELEESVQAEEATIAAASKKEAQEHSKLEMDKEKLSEARQAVGNTMRSSEEALEGDNRKKKKEDAALVGATTNKDKATMNLAELKAALSGKHELLKTLQENLNDLKATLAQAENNRNAAQQKTSNMRAKVDATKSAAGKESRLAEEKKVELQALEQSKSQKQAEAEAKVAETKAKIAEAQERQTKAQSEIDTLNNKVKLMDESNKRIEENVAKMNTEVSAKEKDVAALKRKTAVLKAFLTGPLLSGDKDENASAAATVKSDESDEPSLLMDSMEPLPPL